jgi:mono/diheme cytochrome c family protein
MFFRSAPLLLAILCGPLAAEVRDLKVFYQVRCAVCHGVDGTGRGPNGGRLGGGNLIGVRWETKEQEADLVASILHGKGAMPGFGRQLSEAEVRRLLASLARLPRKGGKGKVDTPSE